MFSAHAKLKRARGRPGTEARLPVGFHIKGHFLYTGSLIENSVWVLHIGQFSADMTDSHFYNSPVEWV